MVALDTIKLTDRPGGKAEIIEAVFGVAEGAQNFDTCQPYFDYYTSEIGLLYAGVAEDTRQIATLATRSYEDVFYVINTLGKNLDLTRQQLRALLRQRFPAASQLQLDRSMNLAIRLWLMINAQDSEFETLRNGSTCVSWNDFTSLEEFIESLFPKARWELSASTSRLGPYFTVAFMHKVCGLKVEWTTSIYDHLRLDRGRNSLRVFPYKCHLERMLEQHQSDQPPPIPRKVLLETLLSLDLLFPIWDQDTVSLLKKEKQLFHTVGPFMPRAMSLLDFEHWRDRLLELQEVLQSPPVSWAQLWRDRRNPQQFWTFWIALVILLLTIISSLTGIVQAWASVRALQMAS